MIYDVPRTNPRLWGLTIVESGLVPPGEVWVAQTCQRPRDHSEACGEARGDLEQEAVLLYGRCGAPRFTARVMNIGKEP